MKNIIKPENVITTDEKKEIADKLKEEFEKLEQGTSETGVQEHEDYDWELTPAEELTMHISGDLAYTTADRFSEMVEGMEIDYIKRIIVRIRNSNYKTAVRMIQAMFLIKGYEDAALSLDLLMACEEYNDEVYEWFIDDLFETDFFEWFLTDMCLKKAYEGSCLSACLS